MPIHGKIIVRDAFLVYGLTFAFGLGAVVAGWRLEEHPSAAYLINVLSGALGFTVSAMRLQVGRGIHLAWVAFMLWLLGLSNVVFGFQPTSAWVLSSFTVLLMALLGASLAGVIAPVSVSTAHPSSTLRRHR